ncbi:MAG: methyltransferase [Hyphomicrobiaceae bacterium]|nr:16S rRNA methyltransferase [Hyphomicrobiaceae bacterium]
MNELPPPSTIQGHAYGIYRPLAMLAGMQLDVFSPLGCGPMTAAELSKTFGLRPDKLSPLLHALVQANLLTVADERFSNTPEADAYLVKGRPTYIGGAHELYTDMWSAALGVAQAISSGKPHARHDFGAMSDGELGAFFRGLHGGAMATGRQLATTFDFDRFQSLLDVGGGSGGVAIAACQNCVSLRATVLELPKVALIAKGFVAAANLTQRVDVVAADILGSPVEGTHDAAVLRYLLQVLSSDQARLALRNVGAALRSGGELFIIGHVLDDARLSPEPAVGMNLVFLSLYDDGQSYTETEHRTWLEDAGFKDVSVLFGAGPNGASIVRARKA